MSISLLSGHRASLSGWGNFPSAEASVLVPASADGLRSILRTEVNQMLARGAGRSYGDAAIDSISTVVLTERLNQIINFDPSTGVLHCGAGVTLEAIVRMFAPLGWFPPVTPGTKYITIGGAIAADVHGKNHLHAGSFARCLDSFTLLSADGEELECSRTSHREIFEATLGGMGLTGIIVDAQLRLSPLKSRLMKVRRLKSANLLETLNLFERLLGQYEHAVCWIDCLASGDDLGRGHLILANHEQALEGWVRDRAPGFPASGRLRLEAPGCVPDWLLSRPLVELFNQLYYWRQFQKECNYSFDLDRFFFPLDSIASWNRLYGRRGFIQYQFAVPLEGSRMVLEEVFQRCAASDFSPFLGVLKRLGSGRGGLSFPLEGYTLAMDLPVRAGLPGFIHELDRLIALNGGRVYLAKDACLGPDHFRQMYADYPRWLEIKRLVDPRNRFASALSRRLRIGED